MVRPIAIVKGTLILFTLLLVGCAKSTQTPASGAVVITPDVASVEVNHTQQFTANMPVTWGASNGTMSSTGLYTAPGAAITDVVTATSTAKPSETASINVTVTPPPQVSINIVSGNTVLPPGQTVQFGATVTGAPNANVVWTSSAGSVTANGLYTAPSVPDGTVETVTATSTYDPTVFASTSVTVTTLPVITASVSPSSVSANSFYTLTLSWKSYNTQVVEIQSNMFGTFGGQPVGTYQFSGLGSAIGGTYTLTAYGPTPCPSCSAPSASVNVYVTVTP